MNEEFRGPFARTAEEEGEVQERQEEMKELITPHTIEDLEINQIIDSINFEEVQRIYSRHLRKSTGKNDVDAHVIPRANIILTNEEGLRAIGAPDTSDMTYASFQDLIFINVPRIRRTIPTGVPLPLYITHQLNHEQGHAVDAHYERIAKSGNQVIQISLQQLHGNAKAENGQRVSLHELISEGVNEKRARTVTLEYFKSNPTEDVSLATLQNFENIYTASDSNPTYLASVHLVNAMISRIAQSTGVASDKVSEAFIHATMMGLDLENPKVRTMLNAPLGQKFIERLRRADALDVRDILDEFNLKDGYEIFARRLLVLCERVLARGD